VTTNYTLFANVTAGLDVDHSYKSNGFDFTSDGQLFIYHPWVYTPVATTFLPTRIVNFPSLSLNRTIPVDYDTVYGIDVSDDNTRFIRCGDEVV